MCKINTKALKRRDEEKKPTEIYYKAEKKNY